MLLHFRNWIHKTTLFHKGSRTLPFLLGAFDSYILRDPTMLNPTQIFLANSPGKSAYTVPKRPNAIELQAPIGTFLEY